MLYDIALPKHASGRQGTGATLELQLPVPPREEMMIDAYVWQTAFAPTTIVARIVQRGSNCR
jgi:hypothetical protein